MWAQVNELLFNKYFGTGPITPLHNFYPVFTRPKEGGWPRPVHHPLVSNVVECTSNYFFPCISILCLSFRFVYLLVAPFLYNRPAIPCAVFLCLFSIPSLRTLPSSPVCCLLFFRCVQIISISFPLFDV